MCAEVFLGLPPFEKVRRAHTGQSSVWTLHLTTSICPVFSLLVLCLLVSGDGFTAVQAEVRGMNMYIVLHSSVGLHNLSMGSLLELCLAW